MQKRKEEALLKITFYGAAKAVTGSCCCIETGGKRILIDCGLKQGRDESDGNELPFSATSIDHVIVTHAHIDHSGRLPLLSKNGYSGVFYCTGMTERLLSIMLPDSAYIQQRDAEWDNQKGKRQGKPPVEPLYTIQDAEATLKKISSYPYMQKFDICKGVSARFSDAGHILGSACVELWLEENGITKKLVFTGDLGNTDQPIIRDPQKIEQCDYLITESTYGARTHEPPEDYTEDLANVLDKVFARGGNVIIPSFAVGRAQELLYIIREIKKRKLVNTLPDFKVYLDSPLATAATRIFNGDLSGYLDDEALKLIKLGENMFRFPGLTLTESYEDSIALNNDPEPKVIISASGMCDAGRIRHHLKHNLWRNECAVVFVGYQAEGSLGRRLLDGEPRVRILGEDISVNAEIINFKGMSAHADREQLFEFADHFNPRPIHVFVVHGDTENAEGYTAYLKARGFSVHTPDLFEVYDLAENKLLKAGIPPKPKAEKEISGKSLPDAYGELMKEINELTEYVSQNKISNKELRKLSSRIRRAMDSWKK